MVLFLAEQYAETRPDVVLALGPDALEMAIGNRGAFAPGVPIVFCCTSPATMAAIERPADVTGIVSEFRVSRTVALARRLQPNSRHLVVIAGAAPFDARWVQIARSQLDHEAELETRYLVGLSREDLLAEVSKLPQDRIVIILTIFKDGAGRHFVPGDIAEEVARASSAPMYTTYDRGVGRGFVGSHSDTFEQIGAQTGDVILRILNGEDPKQIPPQMSTTPVFRVDARQLGRWGLSESNLPDGTLVMYRSPELLPILGDGLIGQAAVVAG
jgi:ABC-type uncharacterized transport system substrate-binding protein